MTEKLKTSGIDYEVWGHHYGIAAENVEKTERENVIDMIIIGIQKTINSEKDIWRPTHRKSDIRVQSTGIDGQAWLCI